MAGAVTAGSYTAGVLDYLLETLERWQIQKDANKTAKEKGEELPYPDTPMYDVIIDVITGASAGGMCAAVATAMLAEGIKLEEVSNRKSKMYRSWIELDDDKEKETIKKMLETDDIKEHKILSLLNSKIISNVAQKMITPVENMNLPAYVDKNLDVILTLSNLYGTSYCIGFQSYGETKNHYMTMHRDFMHFTLNSTYNPGNESFEMDFSNPGHIKLFQDSAVATGAFPVGLQARKLVRNATIFQNKINSFIGISKDLQSKVTVKAANEDDNYPSLNIDGGLFNNEPFGETEKVLNVKADKEREKDIKFNKTNRTILMVDPFPCKEAGAVEVNDDLASIVPKIIGAMRAQSLFKTEDLLESLGEDNFLKYLIVPSKSNTEEPLCCATLGAFGGFLYREFREHDYQLGRRNAQRFLRKHFVMPYNTEEENNNPIHRGWTQEAINIYQTEEKNGEHFLPIIPDVQIHDPASEIKDMPKKPYPISKLRELEGPLNVRIAAIIDAVENSTKGNPKKKKEEIPAVENWFKKKGFARARKSVASFFSLPVEKLVVSKLKNRVHRGMADGTIKWILRDLHHAGLLDERN